jgi:hypothetical protein
MPPCTFCKALTVFYFPLLASRQVNPLHIGNMAPLSWPPNNGQQPRFSGRPPAIRRLSTRWQVGDIAFLKNESEFSPDERTELLDSGSVHLRATGHPVIILDRSADSKYYIVTTVSAYSSGSGNNFLPPWDQPAHQRKNPKGFRAFEGSPSPYGIKHLRLANNRQWHKPKTSWVYIHTTLLVPSSTLITYTKSHHKLHMAPDSINDLLRDMDNKCPRYRQQKIELKLRGRCGGPSVTAHQQQWSGGNKMTSQEPQHRPQPPNLTRDYIFGSSGKVAQCSFLSYSDVVSKRTDLADITNSIVDQARWRVIPAKRTRNETSATCQAEGWSFQQCHRNQTAVPT